MTFGYEGFGALWRNFVTDELRRRGERRIERVNFDLRDDSRDPPLAPSAAKRVLDRLLNHVADPPCGARHEHTQRKWCNLSSRHLVAHELVSYLRSISVDDADIPPFLGKVDDGPEAVASVAELVGYAR